MHNDELSHSEISADLRRKETKVRFLWLQTKFQQIFPILIPYHVKSLFTKRGNGQFWLVSFKFWKNFCKIQARTDERFLVSLVSVFSRLMLRSKAKEFSEYPDLKLPLAYTRSGSGAIPSAIALRQPFHSAFQTILKVLNDYPRRPRRSLTNFNLFCHFISAWSIPVYRGMNLYFLWNCCFGKILFEETLGYKPRTLLYLNFSTFW